MQHGIKLGISSRGLGSVKPMNENGTLEVQDDFELVCWDFVSNPSTHGALMYNMNESVSSNIVHSNVDSLISDVICELTGVCSIETACSCGGSCGGH